ncbi:MAG: DNA polymerase III subunit gamma/tau [Deltaproteobacteria bacterium]|nr:DNA polymerase III subunit gamma/tau [Deltaproteobacteria bacterium]
MPYEVLARKWRPQVFEDVIGQEHITQTLVNAILTGRLAHAYIFGGPRGVGKTSVARIFAKAINCTRGEPGIPCNQCRSCREITAGNSIDVQEIDGASNRGIDEIRELRENAKYMPSASQYRIYIIDEVHMLTLPAFNALLKTLEEPPPHVKFIFATTESHKVPITILSRCQRFDFKRIPLTKIVAYLEKIARHEDVKISTTGLSMIAREAEGSMRDAESLLDQVISFAGQRIEDSQVPEILGIIDRGLIFESSSAVIEGASPRCLAVVEKIYNQGYDIKEFYRALMAQFRNLLISLIAPEGQLIDMSESDKEEIRRQAEMAGEEKLQVVLNFLIAREDGLRFTTYPRLVLETTMIKLCSLGDYLSFGDIMKKIAVLEERLVSLSPGQPRENGKTLSEAPSGWSPNDKEAAIGKADIGETPMGKEDIEESGQADLKNPSDPSANGEKTWEDFLQFIFGKSQMLYTVLKDWHLKKLTEDLLEIESGNHKFSSGYFEEQEKIDQLSGYCRTFFQRDIRVKIKVKPQESNLEEESVSSKKKNTSATESFELPPEVRDVAQNVLDLFEGNLINK